MCWSQSFVGFKKRNIIMISVTKLFFVVYSLSLLQLSIGCNPVADPSMLNHIIIHIQSNLVIRNFLVILKLFLILMK